MALVGREGRKEGPTETARVRIPPAASSARTLQALARSIIQFIVDDHLRPRATAPSVYIFLLLQFLLSVN